jgi:aminoglycoside/choline kinase family phosphotransferase
MTRDEQIDHFLRANGFSAERRILAQDASFRRYWRLPTSYVLMDAPPTAEDVRPFLRLQTHLAANGLSVPQIHAADPEWGLVVLEDFGDGLFPQQMRPENLVTLYDVAVDALATLHRGPPPESVPIWGAEEMTAAAAATFLDWWWPAQFGAPASAELREEFRLAMETMLQGLGKTRELVHRDYFAGNLFWLPERQGPRRVGIIDFQDAALGHPAYDLVSLVEDARRALPDGLAERQIHRYLAQRPELNPSSFQTAYEACAAQRHLRVAALWVRLARRDGKPQYLAYSEHTWRLLARALRHPGARALSEFMNKWVAPEWRCNPI